MQLQVELPHSFRQLCPEPLGIRFSLESNDDVVCKSHDDYITVCLFPAPRLNPQVEYDTPAFSHFSMSRTTRRSAIRCSMNFTSHSCEILSKNLRMSKSSTQ